MTLVLPPFYGGNGSDLGTVTGLSPSDFASFVKEILGNPAMVTTTSREEYRVLPKEQRNQFKRVPYFTAAAFNAERTRRAYENATHCNLICIDIDDSEQARPFAQRPRALAERLEPFAFAAYTTASSTLQAPRLRVVVRAERLLLSQYPAAVKYVSETLLGLHESKGGGSKESKVAVQPMYLPTLFRGDDPVDDHPLIIAVPEGAAVTSANVAGAVAPSVQPPEKKDADDETDDTLATLAFLRPVAEGITHEDVASALGKLDPDCSYPEWVEVAAALRHQFPHGEDAAKAFEVFNEWSARGSKYTTLEDTQKKWDSFRVTPRGRAPITIRSVLKRATDAGWDQAEALGARCYAVTKQWLISPTRNEKELMEQGIFQIVNTPLISDLQRAVLVAFLSDGFKRFGISMTKGDLMKALKKAERAASKQAIGAKQSTPDAQLPQWARGICYVAGQDEFFQRHSNRTFKPEVLDRYFSVQLMTSADESKAAPTIRPRDYLLNTLKCPRVDDYSYSPGTAEMFINDGKKRAVNLYIPTHPDADPSKAESAGEVFHSHIRNLIREPEYQQLLIDYLAYHVQFPGAKIRWAVLLQGAMGCGKTAIAEAMRYVLGKEHVRSIGAELLFTGFNGWAMGAQLVSIEEVRVVGHNRYEVMNSLKPCISNDYISINEKNMKAFQTRNVSNYLMFTNHQDALAVSSGDRRYFVLYSPMQTPVDVKKLGDDYFDRLWDTIRNNAPGLRAWLEQWQISDSFKPEGHAPETPYLRDLARMSASPLNAAIAEVIEDSTDALIQADVISLAALMSRLELKRLPAYSEMSVANILREMGYQPFGRQSINGTRHRLFAYRTLEITEHRLNLLVEKRIEAQKMLD